MTDRFTQALRGLERIAGSDAADRLARTEVRDDGALVLTLDAAAGRRWFVLEDSGLREARPEDETRVPAARGLTALCASGGGEILSWRPGRRMVVRVLARDGAHVVKAYRKGRAQDAATRHEALRAAASAAFRLPRVLRCDAQQETVAFEALGGAPPRADDLGCFQRVGRGLSAVQASAPRVELAAHDRARELAELDRHARRFEAATGATPARWAETRALLDAAAAQAQRALVVAHRDLHEGQLLADGAAIGLLDWDLACRAERELDLANLGVHLRLAGWLGAAGVKPRGAEAAALALQSACGVVDERALRFYVAATALRLVLVHGLRPRARAGLAPLLEAAREAAAETCRA